MELKRVLITGPTGAVGTAIVRELLGKGTEVTALVRQNSVNLGALPKDPGLRTVFADLSGLRAARQELRGKYDVLFHLGWVGTDAASRNDRELQAANIGFTRAAAELAASSGCGAFVFAGSQSEFGRVDSVITPETPCHPDTAYGSCKLLAEEAAAKFCESAGLRFEACRIFSSYGPWDKPNTMVMSTLRKMLTGERLAFTKGEQLWNYIYSGDVGRAFVGAAERGSAGRVYLVASEESRLLKDYILAMRDQAAPGAELHFGELPYYPNQVMCMRPDISSLKHDTGFSEQVSFEEGIRRTVLWLRAQV